MEFGGFQKLTVLDYPGHVACIIFTKGCNFRCPFCHNALLVENDDEQIYNEDEIIAFLEKRKKVLDGVCITGGEPLLHKELKAFLKKVKAMGYDVKLDTNGSFPERLRELVEAGLVDYVAMDIKNTFEKYSQTAGADVDTDKIKESIEFLLKGTVNYEFRTTVTDELHTASDIENIARSISGAEKYFIQNFVDSGNILEKNLKNLHPADGEKLRKMALEAEKHGISVKIR